MKLFINKNLLAYFASRNISPLFWIIFISISLFLLTLPIQLAQSLMDTNFIKMQNLNLSYMFPVLSFAFQFFLMTLLILTFSPGIIHDDKDSGFLVWIFSRPISRQNYVLTLIAFQALVFTLFFSLMSLYSFGLNWMHGQRFWSFFALPLMMLPYFLFMCSLTNFLSLFFPKTLSIAIIFLVDGTAMVFSIKYWSGIAMTLAQTQAKAITLQSSLPYALSSDNVAINYLMPRHNDLFFSGIYFLYSGHLPPGAFWLWVLQDLAWTGIIVSLIRLFYQRMKVRS